MAVSREYLDYVREQLGRVAPIEHKRMFGGVGVYSQQRFFAILHNNALYFKVDDTNRADYEREGMTPFRPFADRPMTMQYYEVPAAVLEDESRLRLWVQRALSAATASPPRRPRKRGRTAKGQK